MLFCKSRCCPKSFSRFSIASLLSSYSVIFTDISLRANSIFDLTVLLRSRSKSSCVISASSLVIIPDIRVCSISWVNTSEGFNAAKSTTVFNYCGIGKELIDVITDTTLDKQGKFSPGVHIPIMSREDVNILDYDYAFLGAWNFKDVIANKEREFVENGGKFITHVPTVMEFS